MTTFFPYEYNHFTPNIYNKGYNKGFDRMKMFSYTNDNSHMNTSSQLSYFKRDNISHQKKDSLDEVGLEWIVNILDSDEESWSNDKSNEFSSSTSSSYSESTLHNHHLYDDSNFTDYQLFKENGDLNSNTDSLKDMFYGFNHNNNNMIENTTSLHRSDMYSSYPNQWNQTRNNNQNYQNQFQHIYNPPPPSSTYLNKVQQYHPYQYYPTQNYQNLHQQYQNTQYYIPHQINNINEQNNQFYNDQQLYYEEKNQLQSFFQLQTSVTNASNHSISKHENKRQNSVSIQKPTSSPHKMKKQHHLSHRQRSQMNKNQQKSTSNKNKSNTDNDKKELESILKTMHEIMDNHGYDSCKEHVFQISSTIQKKFYSKICLEMVEFAKRSNKKNEAQLFLKASILLDPQEPKAWLEYSKMEEELGHFEKCEQVLMQGLSYCGPKESLVLRMIRILSSRGQIEKARSFLAYAIQSLQKESKDHKEWKVILEGAMLEWKAGRKELAISIIEYLQNILPSRTQTYVSGLEFYKKNNEFVSAYQTILKGLEHVPSAGVLWFEALCVQQLLLRNNQLTCTTHNVDMMPLNWNDYLKIYLPNFRDRALEHLSSELVWKFHLEIASIPHHLNDIKMIRKALFQSAMASPPNLLWKVWNKGALLELFYGSLKNARKLMIQAIKDAPSKMRASVLLDMAKLEEFTSNRDKARYILMKTKKENQKEWKVYLESILVEMREKNFEKAIEETKEALKVHPNTGRLWAVLIQSYHMKYYDDIDEKKEKSEGLKKCIKVFKKALENVPKSGEVWCEGARLAMHIEHYQTCKTFLEFALEFTPQYGDSVIEYLRLHLLLSEPKESGDKLISICSNSSPSYGQLWSYCKQDSMECCMQTVENAKLILKDMDGSKDLLHHIMVKMDILQMNMEDKRRLIFGW